MKELTSTYGRIIFHGRPQRPIFETRNRKTYHKSVLGERKILVFITAIVQFSSPICEQIEPQLM